MKVRAVAIEEGKEKCLKIWSAIFKEFRGWTPEQTLDWALRKGHFGASWSYWTFHDPEGRPVACELLPPNLIDAVKERDIRLMLDLRSDAECVLWPGKYNLENRDPADVDWASVRANFEKVISRYWEIVNSPLLPSIPTTEPENTITWNL